MASLPSFVPLLEPSPFCTSHTDWLLVWQFDFHPGSIISDLVETLRNAGQDDHISYALILQSAPRHWMPTIIGLIWVMLLHEGTLPHFWSWWISVLKCSVWTILKIRFSILASVCEQACTLGLIIDIALNKTCKTLLSFPNVLHRWAKVSMNLLVCCIMALIFTSFQTATSSIDTSGQEPLNFRGLGG